MTTDHLATLTEERHTVAPAAEKLRYHAPELHVVASAETLVQGCGPRSGFDYSYYQSYCW